MAILENIRKRTTVLILIIGLALFAFVISGVFTSSNFGSEGKVGSSVADINGNELSIDDFRQKVALSSRRVAPSTSSMEVMNQVWDQEIRKSILSEQFDELGIGVGQDQIIDYLKTTQYAQNPEFQNDNGVFDANLFKQTVLDWKINNPLQYNAWLATENEIVQAAKEQTYFNLAKAGIGASLKEGELDYKLSNTKMDISYVRVPFTAIADSTITISKNEISSYINNHKEDFEQEKARDIQFVYFSEKPSKADDQAVKSAVEKLLSPSVAYNKSTDANEQLEGFKTTTDVAAFLDRNSDIKFDTVYKTKKELPSTLANEIESLSVNESYGPYKQSSTYKVSRLIDKKAGGSVKASHILITYEGATRANPEIKRTKEEAENKAKELLKQAREKDADFAALAKEESDGPSAAKGGDLGYFKSGVMVPAFNDFAFANEVNTVGMVETDFGFHVIKIDDKEAIYQIATLSREIVASEETTNTLFTNATKFEMEVMEDQKAFESIAKKEGYVIRPVNKLKELDENLPSLGTQRNMVQWAFNNDVSIGDIKRFNVNDGYVVAQLTNSYKKGVMSPEDASATVLPILRKERKAATIIEANSGKTIDAFAKDNNVTVSTASALTVMSPTIPGAGREPAIVGRAYGMKQGETSKILEGETGVFMITVTKKTEATPLENYSTYANSLKRNAANKATTGIYDALKAKSEIEDYRANFY